MKIGDLSLDFKIDGASDAVKTFKNIARGIDGVIRRSQFLGKELPKALKELNNNIKKLEPEKQVKSINKQSGAFENFAKSIKKVDKGLIGAALSMWGFSKIAGNVITKTGAIVGEIKKVSTLTGASSRGIQEMMAVLQIKGLDASAGTQMYQQLAMLTGSYKQGGTQGMHVFEKYGVNPLGNINDVMADFQRAFRNSHYSNDIKLRDWTSLGFKPEGLEAIIGSDVSHHLKRINFLTDDQVKGVQKLMESYRALRVQIDSFIRVLGADMAPHIMLVIDKISKWLELNQGDLLKSIKSLTSYMEPLAESIGVVANGFKWFLDLGDGWGATITKWLLIGRALGFVAKSLGLIQAASSAKNILGFLLAHPKIALAVGTLAGSYYVGSEFMQMYEKNKNSSTSTTGAYDKNQEFHSMQKIKEMVDHQKYKHLSNDKKLKHVASELGIPVDSNGGV
ncbi:MAG: hypothetical protein E7Y34_01820, partial [Mycoplasma sp.]|nr:hypothetical protein [Mycoplasma sp.]